MPQAIRKQTTRRMDELEADFPPFSLFCDEITNWLSDIGQSEAELAPKIQDVRTTRPTLPTNELFASATSDEEISAVRKKSVPKKTLEDSTRYCVRL